MNSIPIETERKFLIRYPEKIISDDAVQKKELTQTYLVCEKGLTDRVRKTVCNGKTIYVRTQKRRISNLSAFEEEIDLSKKEYEKLLENADKSLHPINKTRYVIPYMEHNIEIDVYPFWDDRAVMEIELKSEEEAFDIPECITVIKEVTDDKRYKNVNLAKIIPMDEI